MTKGCHQGGLHPKTQNQTPPPPPRDRMTDRCKNNTTDLIDFNNTICKTITQVYPGTNFKLPIPPSKALDMKGIRGYLWCVYTESDPHRDRVGE